MTIQRQITIYMKLKERGMNLCAQQKLNEIHAVLSQRALRQRSEQQHQSHQSDLQNRET